MSGFGKAGEDAALACLEAKGYTPLCRNFSARYGEIDMILHNGRYIIFVEVKSRARKALDTPAAAVSPAKQKKLVKTALCWLSEHKTPLQPRFDVVEVLYRDKNRFEEVEIRHIENAFSAEGVLF